MILAGQKEIVAAYVASRVRDLGEPPTRDYEAIGVAKDGRLIGGIIYTEWREIAPGQHDIALTAAGEPGWLTRTSIRALLHYPFVDLRCVRITSIISKANKPARSLNERLGFKLEGKIRHGRGIGKDCVAYGLIIEDAQRWLA